MKKSILKFALFLGLLFSTLLILNKRNNVFFYTDYKLATKYEYLESTDIDYNTLVIGSSHINRHFIPKIFDAKTGLKSYNLGQARMMTLESMYNLENILDRNLYPKINQIILLSNGGIHEILEERMGMIKDRYFLDWTRFKLGFKYHFNKKAYTQLKRFTYLYVYNLFSVGQVKKLFFGHLESINPDMENKHGFWPYSNNKRYQNQFYKKHNSYLQEGHDFKTKNLTPILSPNDHLIIDELERLTKKASDKNIELILLIPPNYNLHLKAHKLKCLYLGDGVDFPEYFDSRYKANKGHLHEGGAEIYTTRIADLYNQMQ